MKTCDEACSRVQDQLALKIVNPLFERHHLPDRRLKHLLTRCVNKRGHRRTSALWHSTRMGALGWWLESLGKEVLPRLFDLFPQSHFHQPLRELKFSLDRLLCLVTIFIVCGVFGKSLIIYIVRGHELELDWVTTGSLLCLIVIGGHLR